MIVAIHHGTGKIWPTLVFEANGIYYRIRICVEVTVIEIGTGISQEDDGIFQITGVTRVIWVNERHQNHVLRAARLQELAQDPLSFVMEQFL